MVTNYTDIRQSPQYAKYLTLIGWKVEKINGVYCFIKKIPILGDFVKIQRADKLVHRKNYFQLIYEPLTIAPKNIKPSQSPYLPTKTLQLDLTKSKKQLYKNLKKDARYALRKTENIKLDIGIFKKFSEYKNLKKAFGPNCLLLSSQDSDAIFLKAGDSAYYWKAHTNKKGRKALVQYRIVWEGILWAKRQKVKIFDFEGIYDDRFPNKKWLGFTHFKKSFGGHEVLYPGSFTKTNLLNLRVS
ncbi:MAG: peptidoglycan bridge formation glycyltransferase FemA/FemB family protein [Patescibacteria group bacterium]